MKILLLAPELFTPDSGIPRLLRTYLRALCEVTSGAQHVSFVTLNDRSFDDGDLPGLSPANFRSWRACQGKKGVFIRAALRTAVRHDVLFCGHIAQAPVAWWARCRHRRLRYVVLAHGIEAWRPLGALQRLALRRAHEVWCVSDYTREKLLAHNRLRPERVKVVRSGLDPTFPLADEPAALRSPTILTVARLSPEDHYKGIDHLIAALPQVRRALPEARLKIVGRGADRDRLYALAEKSHAPAAVEFTGYLEDVDLRTAFGQAAVFALPSAGEGFGLVYAEALAAGTPCIAADTGGAGEMVTSTTGYRVPYGDVEQLSATLVASLQQTWDRRALVEHARAFSYDAFRDRVATALAALTTHV